MFNFFQNFFLKLNTMYVCLIIIYFIFESIFFQMVSFSCPVYTLSRIRSLLIHFSL
uniref:Uncharacterized protein n=1 Tax=Anguilla anguilla TaxID=7936 RepID=A0A0E9R4Q5_ANGAN